jgi:hypothetical protein
MTNTIYRLFPERLGGTSQSDFIGKKGDIFYNPDTGALCLSDGHTKGGVPLAFLGDLLPTTDNTQYLGSPTKRWHSLYVGPGSVNIGSATITSNSSGGIQFSGNLSQVTSTTTGVQSLQNYNNSTSQFDPAEIDDMYFSNGVKYGPYNTGAWIQAAYITPTIGFPPETDPTGGYWNDTARQDIVEYQLSNSVSRNDAENAISTTNSKEALYRPILNGSNEVIGVRIEKRGKDIRPRGEPGLKVKAFAESLETITIDKEQSNWYGNNKGTLTYFNAKLRVGGYQYPQANDEFTIWGNYIYFGSNFNIIPATQYLSSAEKSRLNLSLGIAYTTTSGQYFYEVATAGDDESWSNGGLSGKKLLLTGSALFNGQSIPEFKKRGNNFNVLPDYTGDNGPTEFIRNGNRYINLYDLSASPHSSGGLTTGYLEGFTSTENGTNFNFELRAYEKAASNVNATYNDGTGNSFTINYDVESRGSNLTINSLTMSPNPWPVGTVTSNDYSFFIDRNDRTTIYKNATDQSHYGIDNQLVIQYHELGYHLHGSIENIGEIDVTQSVGSSNTNFILVPGTQPTTASNGMLAVANGTTWNPAGDGTQQLMIYLNGIWNRVNLIP